MNQFISANYERCYKREKTEEEKAKHTDIRNHRVYKNLEDFKVHLEDESIFESFEYKFAVAKANGYVLSTRLTSEKGSVADPDWMEK